MNHLFSKYAWQIDEGAVAPFIAKQRNAGQRPAAHLQLPKSYEAKAKSSSLSKVWNDYFTSQYSTDKSVLVLPIQGEMSRHGSYWGFGNSFYMRQLNAALSDPDYVGVVMDIDTPGGTADSTPEFAETVANFRKSKPIVTSTAYCASAGVFVASQSSEIVIGNQAASAIGSIGTLLTYENWTKYLEQQGISIEIMRAKGSEDKARVNWIEELSPEARAALQAMLDACQKEFVGYVKRGRQGKITSDEVFTGKMYGADAAVKLGLADYKGDLAFAVKRVLALSKQ